MQQFFNQWLYRPGHPELEIEYSLDVDSQKLKIKITQAQEDSNFPFEFPLEIRLIFTNDNNDKKPETIQISKKVTEHSCDIPNDANIQWISVDPDFKSLNIVEEF